MITYKVDRGDTVKIRIQEMTSDDTATHVAGAAGTMIVERVANGLGMFGPM